MSAFRRSAQGHARYRRKTRRDLKTCSANTSRPNRAVAVFYSTGITAITVTSRRSPRRSLGWIFFIQKSFLRTENMETLNTCSLSARCKPCLFLKGAIAFSENFCSSHDFCTKNIHHRKKPTSSPTPPTKSPTEKPTRAPTKQPTLSLKEHQQRTCASGFKHGQLLNEAEARMWQKDREKLKALQTELVRQLLK